MRLWVDCVWSVDVFIDEDSRRCVVVLWVEVLVTVVSHWAPSGPEKTLEISFSVKIQGGEFYVLPGHIYILLYPHLLPPPSPCVYP